MCKKFIYFILVFVIVLTSAAEADLVGLWRFNEGSGTMVYDLSGNGNDGTLEGDPEWVDTRKGGGIKLDGVDDHIRVPDFSLTTDTITFIAMIEGWKTSDWAAIAVSRGDGDPGGLWFGDNDTLHYVWNDDSSATWGWADGPVIPQDEWVMVALTIETTQATTYVVTSSGEVRSAVNAIAHTSQEMGALTFGWDFGFGDRYFRGVIDEVRIYDHALNEGEIIAVLRSEPIVNAFNPQPINGAMHEDTWVNLSWRAGDTAVFHDVYLDDNFDDVNDGTEGAFRSNQAATFLVAGFPGFAYPEGLVPGTTYYWRVDEVNDTDPNSPWKGDVWSFMIPPKTAYAPDPADAAESVDPDADLSWTAGFGAKLHTVYFGDNFDDVKNAAGGLPQGTATYTPGTLKLAKTYYWRVDEFDAVDTYKGDVWSFTTQGAVGSPDPSIGTVDVKQTQIITWSPGVYAVSHQVYFGTDEEAVKNADTGSPEYKGAGDLGAESYEPGRLLWDTTYYWRIDEANNANPDSPWTGNVWSFTTANFLIVDDFEDYDAGENQIWYAWKDGLGYGTPGTEPYYAGNGSGSAVGDENTPSYTEETIVHGGNQSMPLYYDNSVLRYSEVEKTLTYPRDWTENGVNTLTIWFRGNSANAAETLYVALNGSAVVSHDNPNATQVNKWTQWNIDLQAFADQGVNLANVNTIALGLGNKNNPQAGGSGTMYFDDIRLYPPPPEPAP